MNLFQFDSEPAWVDGIASLWRDRLRLNPSLRLCLPSGHTPRKVFAAMVQAVVTGQVSFREAQIFALDEYGGLAPEDPGRCANMLRQQLIDRIDLPSDRFHFLDPDAPDLSVVCRDYDQAIGEGFDLTVLGIGRNGHLGLNEPGTVPDVTTHRAQMHPSSTEAARGYVQTSPLPTWGLTVGLKQLLGSKEVWLLANGPAKAGIVERIVQGPIDLSVPASLLRNHPNCFLMVDGAAGARL